MTFRHFLVATTGALVVATLATLVGGVGLADVPFYTRGEPREAVVVQEMARGGGYILPLRNGDDVPAKPPVFHWLGFAASRALGRVDHVTTRLPSVVLGVLTVLAVYLTGACVGRIRSGWLAAIALLFAFEWLRAMRTARVDMTLAFFITTALLLFLWIHHRGASALRLTGLWLCLALATLAKGPIGFVLPALIIVVYALVLPIEGAGRGIARRIETVRDVVGSLEPVRGLALVLLLSGGWFLAAWAIHGREFIVEHVLKENVLRVFDADRLASGHRHGPGYLLGQLALGTLPFALLAPAVAWWLWLERPLDPTRRFLVVWVVTVVALFALPQSKRGVYLLPAYPAAALLLGLTMGPGPVQPGPRQLARAGLVVLTWTGGLLGLVAIVTALGLPFDALLASVLRPRDLAGVAAVRAALVAQRGITLGAGLVVIAAGVWVVREARDAHWLRASIPLVAALLALLGGVVAPAERAIAEQRSLVRFAAEIRARLADSPVQFGASTFDWGLVFQLDRHVPRFKGPLSEAPSPLLVRRADLGASAGEVRILLASDDGPDAMLLVEALSTPVRPDASAAGAGSPAAAEAAPVDPEPQGTR